MLDIVIASDHRGFPLKAQLKEFLREKKFFFIDLGQDSAERAPDDVTPPPIIKAITEVVDCVKSARHMCGILICSDGIGASIGANRFKGIRAALCRTVENARQAREHNDANVLCLANDNMDFEDIKKIVTTFINTKPADVLRYKKRREAFDALG